MAEALVTHVRVSRTALIVKISDGRTLAVPLRWYPRLAHGAPRERQNWRLVGGGSGVHWPDLDEDISLTGLLAGRQSSESPRSFARWLEKRRGE